MVKGCLLLVGVFAAAYFVEVALLAQSDIPYHRIVSVALALSVTLMVGAVQGLVDSVKVRRNPETSRARWQDGQQIRAGGVVQPQGPLLHSPFHGVEAVVMDFEMTVAVRTADEASSRSSPGRVSPPSIRGIDVVPFGLLTGEGFVRIAGTPSLRHFPPWTSTDDRLGARAIPLLMERKWHIAGLADGLALIQQNWDKADSAIRFGVVNKRAEKTLFTPDGELSAGWRENQPPPQLQGEAAAEALRRRMDTRRWRYEEYVLSPGAEVTVEGVYRENPPRIEIGRWRLDGTASHAIQPGLPAATAASQWWLALSFTTLMLVVLLAVHYLVYARQGLAYRELLEWVRNWPG